MDKGKGPGLEPQTYCRKATDVSCLCVFGGWPGGADLQSLLQEAAGSARHPCLDQTASGSASPAVVTYGHSLSTLVLPPGLFIVPRAITHPSRDPPCSFPQLYRLASPGFCQSQELFLDI